VVAPVIEDFWARRVSIRDHPEDGGRPIGGFQLVQDLLVRMLGDVTCNAGDDAAARSCRTKA
jgi:alkylation response protein AidB-like acyl-CoA dehydrogenase